MTLEIDVLTLFPAMVEGPLAESIPGRIQEQGLATIRVHDLRDWGLGRHRSVDDAPYGGGAGMVLRPEPVAAALDALRRPDSTAILLDPVGEVFRQARAADLADATAPRLRLPALRGRRRADPLARRPRAVDRRLRADRRRAAGARRHRRGDPPAAGRHRGRVDGRGVVRAGLLEYPQYTRPPSFRGMDVPGDPDVGRPRRRRALARRAGARADPDPPAGPARPPTTDRRRRPTPRTRPVGEPVLYSAAGRPSATTSERPTRSHGCPRPTKEPPRERARRDRPGPAPHRPAGARHG